MPRPRIYTPPVTATAKQDPVEYIPSPQPTKLNLPPIPLLTPPPDLTPYQVNVETQQPYVDPVPSAIAQTLFGVPLRNFQSPEPFSTPIPTERMNDYQNWLRQLPENLHGTEDYDLQGAFLGGAKPEGGHLTDQFKKPNHMTFSTESQYSGRNGEVGGTWVKSNGNWIFYASPTNLKYHSPEELQDYFRQVEPGNTLVLPQMNFGEPPVPGLKPPPDVPDAIRSAIAPPQRPLREFTPPQSMPSGRTLPQLEEPPVPHEPIYPPPPQQVLQSIGIPEAQHEALAPEVAKTFPKATAVEQQPKPQPRRAAARASQPATPPKTFRASPATVNTAFQFSPLKQPEARTGRKVVVSLPDKKVVVYDKDGKVMREYPAYIGRASTPTPKGQFRIMENIKPAESEWYYGGHWLGFARGYKQEEKEIPYAGFHGWVYDREDERMEREEPGWKTSTGGCIQLSNKDVADLASLVGAGDSVAILDTPFAPPPPRPPMPNMRPMSVGGVLRSLIGGS